MDETPSWRIYLLGGFRVVFASSCVADEAWRRRKAAALIKLLALAHGHRLHREQLMETLWPDQAPAAAANSLYQVVHAARQALASVHEQGAPLPGSLSAITSACAPIPPCGSTSKPLTQPLRTLAAAPSLRPTGPPWRSTPATCCPTIATKIGPTRGAPRCA